MKWIEANEESIGKAAHRYLMDGRLAKAVKDVFGDGFIASLDDDGYAELCAAVFMKQRELAEAMEMEKEGPVLGKGLGDMLGAAAIDSWLGRYVE